MLTYGFYNSVNNDRRYNAIQFSKLFDGIITDGVFQTIENKLNVSPNSGMILNIETGRAWFNHTWNWNDATTLITIPASEIILPRIDAIVLEIDTSPSVRENSFKVVKGTPGAAPERPTLTKGEFVNQYPLAYVYVEATATQIVAGDITIMVGTTECPYVTGILETVDQTMLDDIEAYLASITEHTNELTILYYTNKILDRSVTFWEDETTKREEEILTYTDGQLTSVTIKYYDQAGTLLKTYVETITYNSDNAIDRVRRVMS